MDTSFLPVLLSIALAIGGAALVWRIRRVRVGAPVLPASGGLREVEILVSGGYRPDTVRVREGEPVRILFRRLDADPCGARVYFAEPPVSRQLAPHTTTAVTITPRKIGTHLFTCEEGHYLGHLVVEPVNELRGVMAG
jgi:P-type Cu+ transporter